MGNQVREIDEEQREVKLVWKNVTILSHIIYNTTIKF